MSSMISAEVHCIRLTEKAGSKKLKLRRFLAASLLNAFGSFPD